ncbi:MAG: MBL fold metallo-hydrolase [Bacteroidota bacterium]
MPAFICETCGVQYAVSDAAPGNCLICEDERQYIGKKGQRWVTMSDLLKGHQNRIEDIEPGLTGIGTTPSFAIGQRALLVQTPGGNLLWDCVSLFDEATAEAVGARGGLRAIAVSHPHLAGSLVEWSKAFGNAPIYWHVDDCDWAVRPDPGYVFWKDGTQPLWDGLTLIRCGGHFPGSAALHWPAGAEGRGALLTGDSIMPAPDNRWVSFMYSYPNMIPLNAAAVGRIVQSVEPFAFDRLYGGWWDRVVPADAKNAVRQSADRYVRAISSDALSGS